MGRVTSIKLTSRDCVFSIHATPVPQPPIPPYTTPPPNPPQLIGTINATGTTCEDGSLYGCNIKVKFSKSAFGLRVGAETCRVELDAVPEVSGSCAELKCTLRIFDPALTSNVSIKATAGATVAGIELKGTVTIEPKPTEANVDFSLSLCCEKRDGPCSLTCTISNPLDGVLG